MNGRSTRTGNSGYTARVARPGKARAFSGRALAGLILTVLLPPVGLFFLWRRGVFRPRGRAILTGLAALEMTLLCVLLTPRQELTPRMPVPVAPPRVTEAPAEEALNALSNIDQLVYEQQLAKVQEAGGTARDLMTEEEKLNAANDANEIIYDTVVYSVYSEAKYYHATKVCKTQTNGRELTVRDAMREGLEPCPNCNPPSIDMYGEPGI